MNYIIDFKTETRMNILFLAIPILLLISFCWALLSLKKEVKNVRRPNNLHELKKEEEVLLNH